MERLEKGKVSPTSFSAAVAPLVNTTEWVSPVVPKCCSTRWRIRSITACVLWLAAFWLWGLA